MADTAIEGFSRLATSSLSFSCSPSSKTRDTQMATRVTDGPRFMRLAASPLPRACIALTNVLVKSRLQHAAPPGQPPGHLTFLKIIVQIPPYPVQNAVQMPHTRVHSGDQMPPHRGHFTGTKMTEGRRKRLQLSNKIFMNITKTEKHC